MNGRKLIRGTAWSLAGQATTVAASALFTPFVVRQLGASAYGILAFLNLLTGYLAYTDLGMGTASTRFASLEKSAGSNREAEVIWTGISLSTILGTVVATMIIAFAPAINDRLLHGGTLLRGQTITALRIVASAFLLKNISGVLNTPQLVRLRFDTYTAITSGTVLFQIVLTPIILWLGGNLVAIAAMIAVVNFSALSLHFVIGRRLLPQLWPPRLDTALLWPLFTFGALVVLSQVPELVLTNAERFGLTYFTSISSLGYYSIAYTYASLSIIVAIAAGQVLLPTFSRLQSSSSTEELERLYRRSIVSTCSALAPVALVLAVAARPVLTNLIGVEYGRQSTAPCYLLLIGVALNGLSYVPVCFLFASDKASVVAHIRWYELIPYLVVAAVLTMRYGIVGAAAAWSVRALVDLLLLGIAVQKWKQVSFSLLSAFRFGGVLSLLSPPIIVMSVARMRWLWIALLTSGSLVLYVIALWRGVLTHSERTWVSTISRRLLLQSA